jgi:membrane protease YdiL (CAAX protease family)
LFKKQNIKRFFRAFLAGFILSVIAALFGHIFNINVNFGLPNSMIILIIVYLLILAPFAEEILFRGLLFSIFQKVNSKPLINTKFIVIDLPILLSAFLFSISHLVLLKYNKLPIVLFIVCSTFILGLINGHYRKISGNIISSIAAHAGFNLLSVFSKILIFIFIANSRYNYDDRSFQYNFDLNNEKACDSTINIFIQTNLKVPSEWREKGKFGVVRVSFCIDEIGKTKVIKIDSNYSNYQRLGYGCEEEAIKIVSSFPQFKPFIEHGVPKPRYEDIPIYFY